MKTLEKLQKRTKKEKKYLIGEEPALDQLAIMIDYYDLDVSDLSDEDKENSEVVYNNLIDAIRRGKIEIKLNEKSVPVLSQILESGQRLDYVNNIANARANLDFKDQKHFKSNYQFAGALCGIGEDGIRGLDRKDSKIAEYVSTFFLKL